VLIERYAKSVAETDQFSAHASSQSPAEADPREIWIFGLASELGSVISAVKKHWLQEGGVLSSPLAKAELEEELGDAMWYAFALARIDGLSSNLDILLSNIRHLEGEVTDAATRGGLIRAILSDEEVHAFLKEAEVFKTKRQRTFRDYQALAFRTARTEKHTLLQVCAAVLTQLSAQLMRSLLPAIETELNTELNDRPVEVVLGEIAWHLCAIASLYEIDMDRVAEDNINKAIARRNDGVATPLHDQDAPDESRFPRYFQIEFRPVSDDTVEIYWNQKRLGDPLRDQYSIADGYRFHDVIHLANAAVLGWSPVLRDLMRVKRAHCPKTKQNEDGGRSAVVEELVIKHIHWEAATRAKHLHADLSPYDRPLFADGEAIPFSLLKLVRGLTIGHEVYANKYWEWEKAIREGYRVFQLLKQHNGGIVGVNVAARCLEFTEPTRVI
jgi:NTP pyrophosphatase (non-canonical NTP hydrolase)